MYRKQKRAISQATLTSSQFSQDQILTQPNSSRKNSQSKLQPIQIPIQNFDEMQRTFARSFRSGETETAIEQLIDILLQMVCLNDIFGFLKTYRTIAETFIAQERKLEGINVYIQLSQMCDMFAEVPRVSIEVKAPLLLRLAKISQDSNYLNESSRLIKRALQYAWYFQDQDMELYCFERLGQLHYLKSELSRAIYYHSRSQWGRVEPTKSINYGIATQNLKQFFQCQLKLNCIDSQLVSKAPFLPFYFGSQSSYQPKGPIFNPIMTQMALAKQNPRFYTSLSIQSLLDNYLAGDEFSFEISPRQETQTDHFRNPMETFYYALKGRGDKIENQYLDGLKRKMKSFTGFVAPKRLVPQKKMAFRLDQGLRKKPLDVIISERLNNEQNLLAHKTQNSKVRQPLRDSIRIAHLSPNRDINQYSSKIGDPSSIFRSVFG